MQFRLDLDFGSAYRKLPGWQTRTSEMLAAKDNACWTSYSQDPSL